MPKAAKSEELIGVTAFKSRCLGLIDDLAKGKTRRVVLLKHDKPIAELIAIREPARGVLEIYGAMRGTVTIAPGPDITEPTGEVWDAEQ